MKISEPETKDDKVQRLISEATEENTNIPDIEELIGKLLKLSPYVRTGFLLPLGWQVAEIKFIFKEGFSHTFLHYGYMRPIEYQIADYINSDYLRRSLCRN